MDARLGGRGVGATRVGRAQFVDGGADAAPVLGQLRVAAGLGVLHLAGGLDLGAIAMGVEQLAGEFGDLGCLHRPGPFHLVHAPAWLSNHM
jgi:hypothetical protein